jgi:hypothetical protein
MKGGVKNNNFLILKIVLFKSVLVETTCNFVILL